MLSLALTKTTRCVHSGDPVVLGSGGGLQPREARAIAAVRYGESACTGRVGPLRLGHSTVLSGRVSKEQEQPASCSLDVCVQLSPIVPQHEMKCCRQFCVLV